MINHYVPSSLQEALEILSNHECYIIAGGTDLMVQKHRSSTLLPVFDKDVLYVNDLEELNYIKKDEKGVHIGATTKYFEIEKSELVPQALKDVIKELASPNIRNMATLIGNIGNASPAGDTLVMLYVYDAYLVIQSLEQTRTIMIKDFITGVRKKNIKPNELITEVVIPYQDLNYKWVKVGNRAAESISKVSFMGAFKLTNNKVKDLRIAFGSVSTTVVRNRDVENKYIGLSKAELVKKSDEILKDYATLISPINDQRSTKDYRQRVAMNILEKFIKDIGE